MAGQADIINFLTEFLPALAELGVRVEMLERAVYGAAPGEGPHEGGEDEGADDLVGESGELDVFGMKVNLGDILKQNGGDPQSIMKRVAEWKAKAQPSPTPATPPSSTPSSTPTNGSGGST